jgi:hypothetical protein
MSRRHRVRRQENRTLEHAPIRSLEGLRAKLSGLRKSNQEEAAVLAEIQAQLDEYPTGEAVAPLVLARRIHRSRMRAKEIIGPHIMRDPKWEMLLELFIAHHERRPVSVSSLCHAANSPATTSLRHVETLERHGFVERVDDPLDARRSWIQPTPKALDGVVALLREMQRTC